MSSRGRSRGPRPPAGASPPGPSTPAALRLVIDALVDRKAVNAVVLDLRGLCGATDYFVIASGTSDAHVRGMADHLVSALAPRGVAPHHVEGLA
ncbi:MAG TPA: RsfS/YbeB/iojap family protein, partial [Gemmatimonadales bacterium]